MKAGTSASFSGLLINKAIDRALELFDFTIEANVENSARLTEILKARDEFYDYFFNSNSYHTDPTKMQNTTTVS